MTARQLEALIEFDHYVAEFETSPSYGDLGAALSTSKPTARDLCYCLEQHGLLRKGPSRYRPYLMTDRGREAVKKATALAASKKPAVRA